MAEQVIPILHDKNFELSTVRKIVRSLGDCQKMVNLDPENLEREHGSIKDEKSTKLERKSLFQGI